MSNSDLCVRSDVIEVESFTTTFFDEAETSLARMFDAHMVCSCGGSRAVLATAAAILAFDHAGIPKPSSIGGISGGSIATMMYAAGISAKQTLRTAINMDFSSNLIKRASLPRILFAYFRKGRLACTRPNEGVMTSEPLGEFIESIIDSWPKGYWTMAVVGEDLIIFDEHGVFELKPDGTRTTISDEPAPVGTAIRASCAIPGIISPIPYKGRLLFDGGLSEHGRLPIVVPITTKGATSEQILAIDAGEDNSKLSKQLTALWGFIAGYNCIPLKHERVITESDVAVFVKPDLSFFYSLRFKLTPDEKWQAVMASYAACVDSFEKAGIVSQERLVAMKNIVRAYERIESMCRFYSQPGALASLTEQLMTEAGLY